MSTEDKKNIFLVDDDADMRAATGQWLELSGYTIKSFPEAQAALQQLTEAFPGVVVSDVRMPRMDGMALLGRITALDPDIPVVLVTAHGDVQMAVDAMRQGAYDFIEKPFEPEQLLDVVERACEKRRLVMENRELRRKLSNDGGIERKLIGNSAPMRRLREEILDIAETDAPVLILGETGTGKEIVARCLHDFGARKDGRFVAVNCGAVPETVFESELFGHEKGAFTGADQRRIGRFEYAQGGTLFLDEISSMPLPLQVKVLRALQEKEIVRIGSNEAHILDLRLISAANTDLLEDCAAGQFREDLYYRINVVELRVPPLRERSEDIPLLFDYFAARAAEDYHRPQVSLQLADIGPVMSHEWPGNVRELKNIAERFVLSSLPLEQRLSSIMHHPQRNAEECAGGSLQDRLRCHERMLLEQALIRFRGDVQAVMDELDIPRRTLNEKMSRHGLDRRSYR